MLSFILFDQMFFLLDFIIKTNKKGSQNEVRLLRITLIDPSKFLVYGNGHLKYYSSRNHLSNAKHKDPPKKRA
jgi:hypothetical protein